MIYSALSICCNVTCVCIPSSCYYLAIKNECTAVMNLICVHI